MSKALRDIGLFKSVHIDVAIPVACFSSRIVNANVGVVVLVVERTNGCGDHVWVLMGVSFGVQ